MLYTNQEQKTKITGMLFFVNNHIYDKEFYDLFDSIVKIYIYLHIPKHQFRYIHL